jgi:histidinol dehydrogenase
MLELVDAREEQLPVRIPRPRPPHDFEAEIRSMVEDVRLRGDAAVLDHIGRYGARPTAEQLVVDPATIEAVPGRVAAGLMDALQILVRRARRVCERELPQTWSDDVVGERFGEHVRPLRRVGVHAGSASQVIDCVVAAQVAGVEGIAVSSAPAASGEISEAVLAACAVAGVREVYRIGGPAAIAAMAYGTSTVRPVEKVVARGDLRSVIAQRLVGGWVGTGPEAGPGELVIIADETAPARVVAADLVAHAAAGPLGTHALVTWAPALLEEVVAALDLEIAAQDRPEEAENALVEGGRGVLVRDLDQALDASNAFAPECLELLTAHPDDALRGVRNAGAVLMGLYSPAAGSVAGSGGILPTGGSARWSSGLSPRDFLKTIHVTKLDREALGRLAPSADALGQAEGSPARARPLQLRLRP